MIVAEKCAPSRERVRLLADSLRQLGPLPPDAEERASINLDPSILPDFYFALVAICHQTSPLRGPRLQGRIGTATPAGWDYLRARFMQAVERTNGQIVRPQGLAEIAPSGIESIFRDDDGKLLLTAVEERTQLLNDMGTRCQRLGVESVQQIHDASSGWILGRGSDGLLERLAQFEAYSDPVRKKSLFLLALMKNHRLWTYRDPENLKSPVDYHEVRGHLRIGTAVIVDPDLRRAVESGAEVSQNDDIAIRTAVAQALDWLSEETGYSQSELHYFLWNLFRSCCTRETPHCSECLGSCGLPARYRLNPNHVCQLAPICSSAMLSYKICEHSVRTHYY